HLLRLWVRGLTVDWEALYANAPRRMLSLPTYPFARERYWIDASTDAPPRYARTVPPAAAPAIHRPLVPAWETLIDLDRHDQPAPACGGSTAVIGAPPSEHARFGAVYPDASFHDAPDAQTAGALARRIAHAGRARIIWLVPGDDAAPDG